MMIVLNISYAAILEPLFIAFEAVSNMTNVFTWPGILDLTAGSIYFCDIVINARTGWRITHKDGSKLVLGGWASLSLFLRTWYCWLAFLALVPWFLEIAFAAARAASTDYHVDSNGASALQFLRLLRIVSLLQKCAAATRTPGAPPPRGLATDRHRAPRRPLNSSPPLPPTAASGGRGACATCWSPRSRGTSRRTWCTSARYAFSCCSSRTSSRASGYSSVRPAAPPCAFRFRFGLGLGCLRARRRARRRDAQVAPPRRRTSAAALQGYEDSWLVDVDGEDLTGSSEATIYSAAFYFAIATYTSVGYGDIAARTTAERWVASAGMTFGAFFFAYVTGHFAVIVAEYGNASHEQELKDKITHLQSWMMRSDLPEALQSDITQYVNRSDRGDGIDRSLPRARRLNGSPLVRHPGTTTCTTTSGGRTSSRRRASSTRCRR